MQGGVRGEVLCSFGWRVRRQQGDREVIERGGGMEGEQGSEEATGSAVPTISVEDGGGNRDSVSGNDPGASPKLTSYMTMSMLSPNKNFRSSWNKRGSHVSSDDLAVLNDELTKIRVRTVYKALRSIRAEKDCSALFFHLVFLFLYVVILINAFRVNTNYMQMSALEDLFLDEEFSAEDVPNHKKTFHDIATFEEYFQWVNGPFLNAIFADTYYNEKPYDPSSWLMLPHGLSANKVVDSIRFRTVRVNANTGSWCGEQAFSDAVPSFWVQNGATDCYPAFSTDTRASGPWKNFTYETGMSRVRGVSGYGGDWRIGYGHDGYVYYLPTAQKGNETPLSLETAKGLVEKDLVEPLWGDKSTRALVIDMNVVSFNIENIVAMRFVAEVMPGGGFNLYTRMYPINLTGLNTVYGIANISLQCIFLLWCLVKLGRTIKMWASRGFMYFFKSPKTFVGFLNNFISLIVVLLLVVAQQITYGQSFVQSLTGEYPHDVYRFSDIYEDARFFSYVSYFALLNVIFGFFKIFGYLRHFARLTIMWTALYRALPEILSLFALWLVLVTLFVVLGHILFGTWLQSFHSLYQSYSTLFRSIVSDMDYPGMVRVEPNMAGIYYSFVLFFQFFTLLNMFIAVLSEAWSTSKEKVMGNNTQEEIQIALSPTRAKLDIWKFDIVKRYHESGSLWKCLCCCVATSDNKTKTKSGDLENGDPSAVERKGSFVGIRSFEDILLQATGAMRPSLNEGVVFQLFNSRPSNWAVESYSPMIVLAAKRNSGPHGSGKWLAKSPNQDSPYRMIWWYIVHKVCVGIAHKRRAKQLARGLEDPHFVQNKRESFKAECNKTRAFLRSKYGNDTSFMRNWNKTHSETNIKNWLKRMDLRCKYHPNRVSIYEILNRAIKRNKQRGVRLDDAFFKTWDKMSLKSRDGELVFEDVLVLLGHVRSLEREKRDTRIDDDLHNKLNSDAFDDTKLFFTLVQELYLIGKTSKKKKKKKEEKAHLHESLLLETKQIAMSNQDSIRSLVVTINRLADSALPAPKLDSPPTRSPTHEDE